MDKVKELAKGLRGISEAEQFSLITNTIKSNQRVGLRLATSCLRDHQYFQLLLDMGLETADANGINLWLDCVIPKLGIKKVLHQLIDRMDQYPLGVSKTIYWLPSYVSISDARTYNVYEVLIQKANDKGIIRNCLMANTGT